MLRQEGSRLLRLNRQPSQIVAGLGFGLILGMICIRFSIPIALGVLGALLFAYAVFKKPEVALVGILIATSSIVFEDELPLVSVGGISLHIPDFIFLGLFMLVAIRLLVRSDFKIIRTPLDAPLLIFYSVTLLSTFIALSQSSVDVVDARRGIRILSYYLIFFVVTNLVRRVHQLNFLLNSLFLLATVVAAGMTLQFVLGRTVKFLPGRVESLGTQGIKYEEITRILPPGVSIVLVSLCALLCVLVLEKAEPRRWLRFLQLAFLGVALLFTFLRSYWAALIVVLFLLGYLFKGYYRRRLIKWGLMVVSSAAAILLVVLGNPGSRTARLASASLDRFSTLGKSGTYQGEDKSLTWRKIENQYALSAIAAHPLIGLGMGAIYRPLDFRIDWRGTDGRIVDFRKFIHNGHLWIMLQSGLIGYLSLIWLSLTFLVRGFRNWRSIDDDRMKGIVLGFTLAFLVILIAAAVNSIFMAWYWTPVIGIMMGVNETVLRIVGQKGAAS